MENQEITVEQALEVLRREFPGRFVEVEQIYTHGTMEGASYIIHHQDGYMQLVSAITGEIVGHGISCELRDCVDEPLTATIKMHVNLGAEVNRKRHGRKNKNQ